MLCSLAPGCICLWLGESPPPQAGEQPSNDAGSLHGGQEALDSGHLSLARSSSSRHVGKVPRRDGVERFLDHVSHKGPAASQASQPNSHTPTQVCGALPVPVIQRLGPGAALRLFFSARRGKSRQRLPTPATSPESPPTRCAPCWRRRLARQTHCPRAHGRTGGEQVRAQRGRRVRRQSWVLKPRGWATRAGPPLWRRGGG